MIYLVKTNLISHAFERLIDESSLDQASTLDEIELQNIELIKSYIGTRYDVNLIFAEVAPIHNEMITRILVKLVLFDLVRRNAARKVPTDYKEEHKEAMELLEKIATGKLPVTGLPIPTDGEGNPIISNTMWGNNSNKNFYI